MSTISATKKSKFIIPNDLSDIFIIPTTEPPPTEDVENFVSTTMPNDEIDGYITTTVVPEDEFGMFLTTTAPVYDYID